MWGGGLEGLAELLNAAGGGGGGGKGGCKGGGMMPGDWNCPACGDHQFAKNAQCRQCGEPNPNTGGGKGYGGHGAGGGGEENKDAILQNVVSLLQQMMEGGHQPPGGKAKGKGSGDNGDNMMCSVHGKMRSIRNMVEDGSGGYMCRPDMECRLTGTPRGEPVALPPKELKPGDWLCPECGDHQFCRNTTCRKCGAPNPNPAGMKKADFIAQKKAERAARGETSTDVVCSVHGKSRSVQNMIEDGAGGWMCNRISQCRLTGEFHPMAGRGGPRDAPEMKPGDWVCPGCGDHQFCRNSECRKCGTPNPNPGSGKGDFMAASSGSSAAAAAGMGMAAQANPAAAMAAMGQMAAAQAANPMLAAMGLANSNAQNMAGMAEFLALMGKGQAARASPY